jgi:hypothetical protein
LGQLYPEIPTLELIPTADLHFSSRLNRRNVLVGGLAGTILLCAGILFAQNPPAQNVSPERHGNIAATQRFCEQALQRITAAQQANGWDLADMQKRPRICSTRLAVN